MRSAMNAVSDSLRNFHTSLRTAVPGSIALESVQESDHPLAEPPHPSAPCEEPQSHAQPRPRINGLSSKGKAHATPSPAGSQRGSCDSTLDSEWCDLGPSKASCRHPRGQVFDARLLQFQAELLASGSIDMANVRALAFDGVPDRDGMRAIIWKVHKPWAPPICCDDFYTTLSS